MRKSTALFAAILVAGGTIAGAPAHAVGKYGVSCKLGGETIIKKVPAGTGYVWATWYNSLGQEINNAYMSWDGVQYHFATPTGAVQAHLAPDTMSGYLQVTCR